MANVNPYDQFFNIDPVTGKKTLKGGYYDAPKNTFADFFTTRGDASTFDYGKAGYKNPYEGVTNPYAGVSNPWESLKNEGYKTTANPYDQGYIDTLMNSIRKQANQQVTSPQFAREAESTRGDLAAKGVLRGTGYDVMQGNKIQDIFSQAENTAQNAGADARLKGMEFSANQEQSANDYMRNIAQQLGMWGSQNQLGSNQWQSQATLGGNQDKQNFLNTFMNNYLSGENAIETGKSGVLNDLISKGMGWEADQKAAENPTATDTKNSRLALATNLSTTMEKDLDPATYSITELQNFAQRAVAEGYITPERIQQIWDEEYAKGLGSDWKAKDSIRKRVINEISTVPKEAPGTVTPLGGA